MKKKEPRFIKMPETKYRKLVVDRKRLLKIKAFIMPIRQILDRIK